MDFSSFSSSVGYFPIQSQSQPSQDINLSNFEIGTFSLESAIASIPNQPLFTNNESRSVTRNNIFNSSPRSTGNNSVNTSYNGNNSDNQGTRETGIIEKLLVSI